MGPTVQQITDWQDRIEYRLSAYQKQVASLRGLMHLPSGEAAEWDRLDSFNTQSVQMIARLKTLLGRADQNWVESCFDKAHELCSELEDWTETVRVLVACWHEEDQEPGKA